jgi:hypothetical protein
VQLGKCALKRAENVFYRRFSRRVHEAVARMIRAREDRLIRRDCEKALADYAESLRPCVSCRARPDAGHFNKAERVSQC